MRRHLLRFTLTLTLAASTLLPASEPAQSISPPYRLTALPPVGPAPSTLWLRPAGMAASIPLGIEVADKSDHTVLGLIIGGGLGFVAGWAFYNTICEAVDNNCSDSRVSSLVIGTGLGAGLGALIGSLAD